MLPPPTASGSRRKNPYDVSAYDGISFNIKSGIGHRAAGLVRARRHRDDAVARRTLRPTTRVDEYNTRGKLLTTSGPAGRRSTFRSALLAPRYLPGFDRVGMLEHLVKCQAPAWNPKTLLGLQFAVYPQFSTTTLNYDLWVDDVTLYTGSNGLATVAHGPGADAYVPARRRGSGRAPSRPAPTGKYLADMYDQWKATFVTAAEARPRACGPENSNDIVSEGIGYGMLIAVNMDDKTLFDGLWSYEQGHKAAGNLMTW